jgi:hypothetical protein
MLCFKHDYRYRIFRRSQQSLDLARRAVLVNTQRIKLPCANICPRMTVLCTYGLVHNLDSSCR